MSAPRTDNRGLLEALLGDGHYLLSLSGVALVGSGAFAILQSISGQLLPHDLQALGLDTLALRKIAGPHLVGFMFHDRVAFGGTLLAVGVAYWWLAEFPLRQAAAWAWWTFLVSGVCGFLSFLAYLGYGYFDTWHGVATLLLLPVYAAGLWRARSTGTRKSPAAQLRPRWEIRSGAEKLGRILLVSCGAGLVFAGLTILAVGMTFVFVPQDIAFIGLSSAELRNISPILIPLLAHDRAGFGGGLFSVGILLLMMMRYAPLSRSLVQVIVLMGLAGFGSALGVHFAIGYTDPVHLSPAYVGFAMFTVGSICLVRGLAFVETDMEKAAAAK